MSRTRATDLAKDAVSPIAEPGARMGAVLIDALIRLAPLGLVAIGAVLRSPGVVQASGWLTWIVAAVALVIDLVLLARYGQTIGKRVMGLRIVRTDGARARLGRLFWLRAVIPGALSSVPILGWLFGVVDTCAIFSADRRTLHDRMADTIVIDLRAPASE